MTESEWLECPIPDEMLKALGGPSKRKLRLFVVACCRLRWQSFTDVRCRQFVEVAERLADGQCVKREWREARRAAERLFQEYVEKARPDVPFTGEGLALAASDALYDDILTGAWGASNGLAMESPDYAAEHALHCRILREIFGNPFHRLFLDSACLTPAIAKDGEAIYDARAFDRLPELAAALEHAGCQNPEILAHLRPPGPHVRGCWALDLILGKE